MKFFRITSLSNPLIKDAVRIRKKHDGHELFLVEGPHLIEMAAASPEVEIKRLFFTEAFASREGSKALIGKIKSDLVEVTDQILSKLADTGTPQGIIAIASYRPVDISRMTFKYIPLLVVCDGIQDPGNLGTIMRVADAAGADAVIMLPGTCDMFNPKAIRATAGSLFNIPFVYSETDTLISYLRSKHIRLYVADVHSRVSLYEADFKQPAAIAFGNEAHGPSEGISKNADTLLKIPIIGKAESLNVATAASVCLYEAVRQRNEVSR